MAESIAKASRLRRIFETRRPVWTSGSQVRDGLPVSQKLIAPLLRKVYEVQLAAFAKSTLSGQAPNTGSHARGKRL